MQAPFFFLIILAIVIATTGWYISSIFAKIEDTIIKRDTERHITIRTKETKERWGL